MAFVAVELLNVNYTALHVLIIQYMVSRLDQGPTNIIRPIQRADMVAS